MLDVRLSRDPATASTQHLDTTGDACTLRAAAGRFARALTDPQISVDASGLRGVRLAAFVEGLVLGSYRFSPTSTAATPGPANRIDLIGADDTQAVATGLRLARATGWARDLANTPASRKSPQWLADQAVSRLSEAGVAVRVRDAKWLADHGFGGVLAVGAGSRNPPRLIEASWRPRGPRTARAGRAGRAAPHPVIVGKGITFDTGGLNLKPADAMRSMHTDMAGAAAALAAIRAVAEAKLPVPVTVLVPAAENSLSGSSMRPGDVIRHVGGRTSEVTNTDAEGRLVLADALSYAAARLAPTALVDIATLTGAMKIALGLRTAGLFATTDGLASALGAAAAAVGEPLWRMPLVEDYRASLDSAVADADNAPGNPGAITAALFLRPFTGALPWAHLDIAGPARAAEDDGVLSRGATGFGARLLAHWLATLE